MKRMKVRERIAGLSELPSLAVVKFKLLKTLNDESSTIGAIAELVRYDHAIIAKIIAVANSAQFGFMGKITTIEQAILLLGLKIVRNITLGVSIFSILLKAQNELKKIWAHSYMTASVAERICAGIGAGCERDSSFLAGLLHDVGRPVLFKAMKDEVGEDFFRRINSTTGLEYLDAEKSCFGCTHAEAGAWFLENLSFPEEIVQAVLQHHDLDCTKQPLGPVLITSFLAEGAIAAAQDAIIPSDGEWSNTHERILLESGLKMEILEEIGDFVKKNEMETQKFFELI